MAELAQVHAKPDLTCIECGDKTNISVPYGVDYDWNEITKKREAREIRVGLCPKHLREWRELDKVEQVEGVS